MGPQVPVQKNRPLRHVIQPAESLATKFTDMPRFWKFYFTPRTQTACVRLRVPVQNNAAARYFLRRLSPPCAAVPERGSGTQVRMLFDVVRASRPDLFLASVTDEGD